MGNNPRWVPSDSLVEVTCRVLHGLFLLRPSRDLNEIAHGILARAASRYDVEICAYVVLSNHMHLLLVASDAEQLSLFMGYVNGNLAKEAGRLHHWRERFWGRRYSHVVLSDEPTAQEERLRYLLEQGCKENLVRRPEDWPGASSTRALLTGQAVRGTRDSSGCRSQPFRRTRSAARLCVRNRLRQTPRRSCGPTRPG